MSAHLLPVSAQTEQVINAGAAAGLAATIMGWLPEATAVVIFIYYVLLVAAQIKAFFVKRRLKAGKLRRATDVTPEL